MNCIEGPEEEEGEEEEEGRVHSVSHVVGVCQALASTVNMFSSVCQCYNMLLEYIM